MKLITEHIDTWTSAIKAKSSAGRGGGKKQELYGIKKLRELILELAVRGLLVPQDPNDEPVSELLKKGAAEKAKLVATGKVKKQKPLPPIKLEEMPYNLPQGWSWARLSDVAFFQEGPGILAKDFRGSGVPLIRISGMHGASVSLEGCNFLEEDMVEKKWSHFKLDLGDIVLSSSASLGKVAKVGDEAVGSIVYTGLIRFRPYAPLFEGYLTQFFESNEFIRQIDKSKTGAAIKHFGPTHLKAMLIPIPSISEQHRIVAKVDELMALCDQLEQQTEDGLRTHKTLVKTLLGALTSASDPDRFSEAWKMIESNFDALFTTESSIDELKQTILQLAVMGKLVPQDPNDEPASELLKKIAAEKAKLVKDGVIKKQSSSSSIADEEILFTKPEGWQFCRLKESSYIFSGNGFKSGDFNSREGVRVIKITNAGVGELIETDEFLPMSFESGYENFRVFSGDLILALTRPYIAAGLKVSICPESYDGALLNQRVAAIRCFADAEFLSIYMQSVYVLGLYKQRFGGNGLQPNLKMADVTELVAPLPPLSEQHRIVAKVDELMALCDRLKAGLQTAQTTQLHLADTLVETAIS
jgi:type I restriction enzyme S subunit